MWMWSKLVEALLPATSAAVPRALWSAPSPTSKTGSGQLATPEVVSEHSKLTVTCWLVQVSEVYALPSAVCACAPIVGGVRSTLRPSSECLARLPARSIASPSACWLAPSPFSTTSPGHVATPERASSQAKRIRTALLNQPDALAVRGEPSSLMMLPLIVGGVRSMLNAWLRPLPWLPALSFTDAVAISPAPSPVTTESAGIVVSSTPDRLSSAVQ